MNKTKNTRTIRNAAIAVALGASALLPAAGETIYRCGDSYSQQPCPNARTLDTNESRVSTDARGARLAAQRDAALADTMEKARLKEEAKPANAYIPVAAPRFEGTPAEVDKPVMTKGNKPHVFTAVAPREPKEKKEKKTKGKTDKPQHHSAAKASRTQKGS